MRGVQSLLRPSVAHFRDAALTPRRPALLASFTDTNPRDSTLPALYRWFESANGGALTRLNASYFERHSRVILPVEVTEASGKGDAFRLESMSLGHFVDSSNARVAANPSHVDGAPALYLAQCAVDLLPRELQDDVPTPELVKQSGRGDVYASTIWIGPAPTYTPLHKDPNPNILAQLAGSKTVRLMDPTLGLAFYQEAQRRLSRNGSPALRGSEMMGGDEKKVLDELVWHNDSLDFSRDIYEQTLKPGDAIFIPQGWWHSIKGIGTGITGSVNWWFR